MCGRFFHAESPDLIAQAFGVELGPEPASSYNVAPGQQVLVVRNDHRNGCRTLDPVRWGLIPHFAKDTSTAFRCINARAETVDTRASYRSAFAKRRCLVIASGFYEWKREGKRKLPFAIARADGKPFGMAGLWANWKDPQSGEWIRSCAVITTDANQLLAPIHDRMPVIIEPADYARWLGEVPASPEELKAMLRPLPAAQMRLWPVSTRVNAAYNDDPELIRPETTDARG